VGRRFELIAGVSLKRAEAMELLFTCLITLQFLAVVLHDLIRIPGWTRGDQVQAVVGKRFLWMATLINAIFPGLAVAFAIYFFSKPKPRLVVDYWTYYCAITLCSAIFMWYVPYFFGAPEKKKRQYLAMYAGTYQILPRRGDNPRPNLLHVCFHVLFVASFAVIMVLRFRG
jgi:hypothetical protein